MSKMLYENYDRRYACEQIDLEVKAIQKYIVDIQYTIGSRSPTLKFKYFKATIKLHSNY